MGYFETFDDKRAQIGAGSALYVKLPTEDKYSLALPLEGVPMVIGAPESVEFDITTSTTRGRVEGKIILEEKEVNFLAHRDNFLRLNELVGKDLDFLAVNADYSGWKYSGTISFRQEDTASGELSKGVIKITPKTAEQTPIEDVRDLLKPTVKFASTIPADVKLSSPTGTEVITVETSPTDATLTVSTNQSGSFTAEFGSGDSSKKLTITGTNGSGTDEKYGVVYIKASKEGYASWTTTIAVTVPAPEV